MGRLVVGALVISALTVLSAATPATAEIDPPPVLADWGRPASAQSWYPVTDGMAFDPEGDLWTLETWYQGGYANYAVERDPTTGTIVRQWPWDIFHGSFLEIDPSGNLWTFVPARGEFTVYSQSGNLLRTGTLASVVPNLHLDNGTHPSGYAIDGNGDIWTLGGTLDYEQRVFRHDSAGEVMDSWPRPPSAENIAIGPDGDVYFPSGRYDAETGAGELFIERHLRSGELVSEIEIGSRASSEAPWQGVLDVLGLAVDPDGTIVVAGPMYANGEEVLLDDTLLAAYSPAGELLVRWGPAGIDETVFTLGGTPSILAIGQDGTIAVQGEDDHFWTYGQGDACTLPQEGSAGPELGGSSGPPAVGGWRFAGCWTKTGPTRWEATGQINANGLLVTPDTGGRVVLDSGAGTLVVQGQATVETGAFSVAGRNFPSIVLHQGAVDWGLNAATLPLPLRQGLRFLGFGTDASSATMDPDAGSLDIGPIAVDLPALIGGTGNLTLRLGPTGVKPTSWQIGPTQRLLGGLLPVENLMLRANDKGWGTAGDVVIPGANGVTLGGSVEYNTAGELTGASVRAGNLSLFGGVLPVKNLTFSWSAQNGWGGAATAPIPGQSDSSVTIGLTYGENGITTGRFEATRIALGSVANLEAFGLVYNAAQQRWAGGAQVRLGDTTVAGNFVMKAGEFVSGLIDVSGANLPLAPGVSLRQLGAAFHNTPWSVQGTVGIGAGPTIENKPAVLITGNGSYTYPSSIQPGRWHVDANVALTDFQLLAGSLDVHTDGRVDFAGQLGSGGGFNFAGVSLNADLAGWAANGAYSAQGAASIGVNGLDIVGRAVVSSTGVAACGGVKSGWTWQTGLGYRWVGNQLTVLAGNCDLRPWTTQSSAPSSAPAAEGTGVPAASFVVPADAPVHAIELTGTTAPPLVTLEGPGGESYTTPTDPEDLGVQDEYVVLQDTDAKTTTFLIDTPTAGPWQVHLQVGSAPLAEVATAEGLDDPEVTATVTGTGANRQLAWTLTPLPGQSVTFVEHGPESTQVLTTTSAATGQVAFTPAAGPAGTRDIIALVEQDGVPRAEIVAGSYDAPGGVTVTVERSGTGGTVTSTPAGITCGPTCAATFAPGTEVTLTATPDAGTTFAGWGGACEGVETCTFTADGSTTVTAAFASPNQAPTAPSVTGPTAAFRATNTFTVDWGGAADGDGTIADYDVRYRSAGLNGAFAAPVDWQTATAATSAPFTGTPATTYCFSARATDDDGATSAWSTERCTTTPLDDRGLTARNGFVRRTQTGNLANTHSEATRTGATLTRNAVTARQLAVIVQRCRGCGTVRIRHANQTVGTINLNAQTTRKKQIVTFTLPQARTGSLVLTVTSNARPVRIDGIAALP